MTTTEMQRHAAEGISASLQFEPLLAHRGTSPVPPIFMTTNFEPLLSDTEAGELLGLHHKTVQRLARAGELPAVRIGRYWRFRASALNSWIEVNSTGQSLTERNQ